MAVKGQILLLITGAAAVAVRLPLVLTEHLPLVEMVEQVQHQASQVLQ
jgi:hypothetical protein